MIGHDADDDADEDDELMAHVYLQAWWQPLTPPDINRSLLSDFDDWIDTVDADDRIEHWLEADLSLGWPVRTPLCD